MLLAGAPDPAGPDSPGSGGGIGMERNMARPRRIGILTAGGDSPGLNAAIRGVGKTALGFYGMEIIGFRDGFRGLVEDRAGRARQDRARRHPHRRRHHPRHQPRQAAPDAD